jgi:hypothetical protein
MTLFQLAAVAWIAGAIARPLMYVTGTFGFASTPGASLPAAMVGAAVGVAVGAFLWLRPGRGSALAGVLFGFYVIPTLLLAQVLGTPPWLIVLAIFGIAAFALSAACLWQTRRGAASI